MNLTEFSKIFKYLVKNNKKLIEEGKSPLAIGIEGSQGIGKTAILKSLAEEMGMTYVCLCLSELEEISDLTGFPLKEFKINELDEEGNIICSKWVPHDLIQTYFTKPCETYQITDEYRMSYATPAWLPKEENPNGTLLVLDDFTRGNSLFMQATMTLIQTGKYISWNLPKNTMIALSSNPDNGQFSVSSLDPAQKSRFINFEINFSIDSWASWAENNQIDSRAINFALSYHEELFKDENLTSTICPRSYTMFCNAISSIENWESPSSLVTVLQIANGCFGDKDGIIGTLFTTFINNKLDKLITPKDLLLKSWDSVKSEIESCVYTSDGKYRPDIAAILHTRLMNYCIYYFSQKNAKTSLVQDRLIEIIDASADKMLFSEDFIFDIIKTLVKLYPARTNKFMTNAKIMSKIL